MAALPTSLEWQIWWNEWSRHVEQKDGWERALVDAVSRLVRNNLTLARMIRNEGSAKAMIQYNSDGYVWGEELRMPDEITREALVWFLAKIRPTAVDENGKPRPELPGWAQHLFKAVEGCYIQQARLGIEQTGVKRRGYLTLNHSATAARPDSFPANGSEVI
jgi:hypothetical protein